MDIEITNEDKVKQSQEALEIFFNQFGENSIYKLVFLETVFEELFKKDNILILENDSADPKND